MMIKLDLPSSLMHLIVVLECIRTGFAFQTSKLINISNTKYSSLSSSSLNDTITNRQKFLTTFTSTSVLTTASIFYPNVNTVQAIDNDQSGIATFALRRAGALPPSLSNIPPNKLGIFVRFGEQLLYSNDGTRTQGKDVFASFDFPADWLQLDRMYGGIQYVDQRNGDKLYLLKVRMPEGIQRLHDVPKSYFGDAIFSTQGDLYKTGNNIEEYKVLSSQMLIDPEEGSKDVPRRRLKVRYTTVTGNNFAVERKGLVDAWEVQGMIYMLMTGSNSVLFDKKGLERDTVEYIVDSFRVQPV